MTALHIERTYTEVELDALLDEIAEQSDLNDAAKLEYARYFIARCHEVPEATDSHIARALGLTRQAAQQIKIVAAIKYLRARYPSEYSHVRVPKMGEAKLLGRKNLTPEEVRERKNAAHRRYMNERREKERELEDAKRRAEVEAERAAEVKRIAHEEALRKQRERDAAERAIVIARRNEYLAQKGSGQ